YNTIGRLSGGEKRRLYLLRVLMSAPNVLFLDEPTNDLDITTLTILEDYLDQFPGIIVTVSHDRYFLDRICDSLLVFRDHVIEKHIGGYSANMEQLYSTASAPEKEREKPRPSSAPKMSTREKQELDHMEADIAALEEQIAQIDAQMQAHTDFREIEALSAQRMDLEQQMEGKMERWMELSERKAQIDAYYRK
ncbi:MAG: ATP-binding cassette domain-containing protein, partial [Merdibacter sp.]